MVNKRIGFVAISAGILFLVWLFPVHQESVGAELELNAGMFVLVDLSTSYYDEETHSLMGETLDQVNKVLVELTKRWPTPLVFHYLSIDEISLGSAPLCSGVYKSSIFGLKKKNSDGGTPVITKRSQLKRLLVACRDVILSQKPKKGTDISGAVDLAARMAVGQARGPKAIIVISDFLETRWDGAVSPDLNLNGFKVAMIYRVRKRLAMETATLNAALDDWKNRFKSAGANRVFSVIERGPFHSYVLDELSK